MKKNKKTRILLIEDEIAIQQMIIYTLGLENFEVKAVTKFQDVKNKIAMSRPDLILLDWMLPGKNGIYIARYLKNNADTYDIPIIMLTAKAEEENKISGLEAGADDYIVKPFSPKELIARIKAVLRRGVLQDPAGLINIGLLCLDTNRHQLLINHQIVKLAPIEYQLLYFLMKHQERVFSRDQLLDRVWKSQADMTERTVDVQIRRLRQALALHGCDHYIKTIRNGGYCFNLN